MKQKAARICFIVGACCLLAAFIPGESPVWFVVSAAFAIGATVFGARWIRIASTLLVVASVVFVILERQAARESKENLQEMQQIGRAREAKTAELRQKLLSISIADGVSESEAELIAECYFDQNVDCGAFTGIQDGGDFWIVDGLFGFAAKPVKGFHINKLTGKITSPIGPSYATPTQIFR